MPEESQESQDLVAQIHRLLQQAIDGDTPVLPRITAAIAVGPYMDTLIRHLVNQAREEGRSWEELADIFVSSPLNVRQRYGSYRNYDDDDE